MAGPGDDLAASAGRGHLGASRADREQVIDTLKAAFVQARLTRDEFDQRVSQTLTSRTYAGLAAFTADLPTGLMRAEQLREPAPAQAPPPVNEPVMWSACAVIVAALETMAVAIPADILPLLAASVLAISDGRPVAGTPLRDSWRKQSSGGQAPPGPAQPHLALEGEQDGGIRNDPALFEARWNMSARQVPVKRELTLLTGRRPPLLHRVRASAS